MEIRKAHTTEATDIANIFLGTFRNAFPTVKLIHEDDETREWFRDQFLPQTETWLALENGNIVGFISLDENSVEKLFVEPSHQRRGIGAKLLNFAKAQRPRGLTLTTFKLNSKARQFYEHQGFDLTGETNGSSNEEHEPEVIYEWSPAPTS